MRLAPLVPSPPAELTENHPPLASVPENYAFIMNVWHLKDTESYSLAPGYELRRASPGEVRDIKEILESHGPTPQHLYMHLWECQWPHPGGSIDLLPSEEWRYFVVAYRGSNSTAMELERTFDLAPLELEVGFTVSHSSDPHFGRGISLNPGRLFHVLDKTFFNKSFFVDVSESDIEAIQTIYGQLQKHDHRLVDVNGLVKQLNQLKGLPHESPLRFLGYFALLESLLTHKPKPSDPYDSITRQVKKKIALLDHRWPRALDYSPFRKGSPDTVWSKMYTYRSQVAHGDVPDFAGELKTLHDHEAALELIKQTVKAVIRQMLTEPQLLLDLREC